MSINHDLRSQDGQVQITLKFRRSTIDALDQAVGERRAESRAALVRRAIGQELSSIGQQREIELVADVVAAHLDEERYPDSTALAQAEADTFRATDPDEDWSELLDRAQAAAAPAFGPICSAPVWTSRTSSSSTSAATWSTSARISPGSTARRRSRCRSGCSRPGWAWSPVSTRPEPSPSCERARPPPCTSSSPG